MVNGEPPVDLSQQLSEIWEHILQIRAAFLARDEMKILKSRNAVHRLWAWFNTLG